MRQWALYVRGGSACASTPCEATREFLPVAAGPVSLVALPWLRLGLRIPFLILTQRATHIVGFLEFPLLVAANKPLVALVRLDELSVVCHWNLPDWGSSQKALAMPSTDECL